MEEKKSQISLNDAMDHYEGVSHVKCLWSSKIIRIDGLVWSVPESNEVWLKEGGHLKVLLVKGNTYAEIIGGKKKSRDLLSEVKEYFPLNAKVHCIATDVPFFITDKSNFYLLDDHTVHYALGGQSYKFPKRTQAVVYECSQFASFYNVFPEGSERETSVLRTNDSKELFKWNPTNAYFNKNMEFDENDIQAALNSILEFPTLEQQNQFWLVIRERIINGRNTEMQELNENVNKERERIQLLKDSLEDLT